MPQAMEWSLATPMIRPRLPAISPVLASAMMRLARGFLFHFGTSLLQTLEDQRGVGAAEAEGVGQRGIDLGVVDALAHDVGAFDRGIEFLDIGAFADEAVPASSEA